MSLKYSAFILFVIILVIGGPVCAEGRQPVPFREGEKLVYRAKWGSVSAGEAVLEILPCQTIQGKKTFHFAMTVRTNPPINVLYPIRERQDSFMDADLSRTLHYEKKSTGYRAREAVVRFDWENLAAVSMYSGALQKPVKLLPGTLDPLSVIFSIRAKKLKVGETLEFPITDGKKCAQVKAFVSGKEILSIEGRDYETYVVEPDMATPGFLKRGRRLKLWYSADASRIPVKLQSRFPVGSFVFELVSRTT
ncbi:MAG TPA: DUF3108 domain-containing protein [Syntrophales bacterium]|nr:DUF3108 domain-containing protein [Syntrophales bacterium]